VNICTIIAKNYVAHARVLARSFTEHHPDGRCYTLIVDDPDVPEIDPASEPFTLLTPADLDLSAADFDDMRSRYTVLELSTAVKPWLLRYMLDHVDDGSGIAYFDPDIQVHSRMEELEAALGRTGIVLTPHLTKPMPRDGGRPAEPDIMIAGIYNLGFIGLSQGQTADELVEFWAERLRHDCWVAPADGLFVDQKWMDWIPGFTEDLTILRDTTYNVAYWNLMTREFERADGTYLVDGRPLRFFHFSGYSPKKREQLSKHQDRIRLLAGSPLHQICDAYGDALEADGVYDVAELPYTHDVLPSGLKLDMTARRLYRDAIELGRLPTGIFDPAGEAAFIDWLNGEIAPGYTRYLEGHWEARADLQRAYPEPSGADRLGFLGWCVEWIGQLGKPVDPLLASARRELERASGADAPDAPAAAPPEREISLAASRPFGVNVVGYLRSELGVGEVARQLSAALDVAHVPTAVQTVVAPMSRQGQSFAALDRPGAYPVNLLFVNADALPSFAEQVGDGFFRDRHTIGYWWWELEDFPEDFQGAFDYVDEIWVGSTFVADAITPHTSVPVIKVPAPLELQVPPPLDAGELGWPSDRFTFLFSWDYNSVFARKNPLAVIDAYTRAFDPKDGAALVLKCINAEQDPTNHERLVAAIEGRPDIHLLSGYLAARDKNRLAATCDCYVSLHRSEGLGLTLAEAMLMGKPVIGTDYGGCRDFLNAETGYPVRWTRTEVGAGAAPYPASAHWAEPDVEHAARLMREVFDAPEASRIRGARGQAFLHEHYSVDAIAKQLLRRTEALYRRMPLTVPVERPDRHRDHATDWLVERGTTPRAPSRFGKPGAAARRLLLRLLKPYTAYQLDVNRSLLRRIDDLEWQLDEAAARHDADALSRQGQNERDLSVLFAQLRQHERRLEAFAEQQEHLAIEQRPLLSSEIRDQLVRVARETAAMPYMTDDLLSTFSLEEAGIVFGYRDAEPNSKVEDDAYRSFEDLFRGSEEFIRARQTRYLPLVAGRGPVVDLGCGRGEFLDVLSDAGIQATGVDLDEGMLERARARGHADVIHADALSYLESVPDGSLGVVFSAQVVEHLPPDAVVRLFQVAARKLRPGGRLITETVNPHSVAALKTFWVDITHHHPLFPEVLVGLARTAGFASAYVFHPNGTGDVTIDRLTTGEYAVVATLADD
jgi:glycosyltransferase involved in cell wall biosynthesis/SAM-dependent methyltransferase